MALRRARDRLVDFTAREFVEAISSMLFELRGVCLHDEGKIILDDIDFSLESGECVAVTGPSGAGKTTFLKLFNRLVTPTKGEIFCSGKSLTEHDLTSLRRDIGFLFQEVTMMAGSIGEVLLLPFRYAARRAEPAPDAGKMLSALSAACFDRAVLDQKTDTLSGGEKQRVAIARILLGKPKFLLLDEPTSALDDSAKSRILENIRDYLPGATIVFVTHDRDLIGKADRKLHFRDGKITLNIPVKVTLV
ncbi:ABC transporter ATP-binding protein [Candidatus Ozemobacteraceae bacterium]|nr:ABC transporter ATP-binding protein [Candidatus Ozemobacteraceae bacterium]